MARARAKIFFGWWIVVACFTSLLVAIGIGFQHFGVFLKYLAKDFGVSRAEVAAVRLPFEVLSAATNPLVGRLTDKYGPKMVMILGAILVGGALILLAWNQNYWQLYPLYAGIGAGFAAMALVPSSTTVSYWFKRRRGLAMGITVSGMSVGVISMVPLTTYLIESFGWRTSYLILGFMVWAITIPIIGLLIKRRPEDMGLFPDGDIPEGTERGKTGFGSSQLELTTAKAVKTLSFWILFFVLILIHISFISILVHLIPFTTDQGITLRTASFAMSFDSIMSILGRLTFGILAQRFQRGNLLMLAFLLQAMGVFLLTQMRSVQMLFLALIPFGLGLGGQVLLQPLIIADCFGMVAFGEIYGWLHIAITIGSGTGPVIVGYIFDITESYYWAFLFIIGAYMTALTLVPFAKIPKAASR